MFTKQFKIELSLVLGVIVIAVGWILWHDYKAQIARDALDKEHQKQTDEQVNKLRAASQSAVDQANQANAQQIARLTQQQAVLIQSMNALTNKLATLEQAESDRLSQVQQMSVADLVALLREQLGPVQGTPVAVPLTQHDLATAEGWKVKMDSCEERSIVQGEQFDECKQATASKDATIRVQGDSIDKLNAALKAEQDIQALRDKQYKEDLIAAKGTKTEQVRKWLINAGIGVLITEGTRAAFHRRF